jgi:hypothetical protein
LLSAPFAGSIAASRCHISYPIFPEVRFAGLLPVVSSPIRTLLTFDENRLSSNQGMETGGVVRPLWFIAKNL